jgi:hypothetical protein
VTASSTTIPHVRRTESCEKCGANDVRVTYEWASASASAPGVLIAASCTNEECEWFDRRTKRRVYPGEAVARVTDAPW